MQTEGRDFKRMFLKFGRQSGLVIIILAAIVLEAISAFQYYYTRGMLERKLEEQMLILLQVSAQRMDGIMRETASATYNQLWHAQQHLDDADYMETLVRNMVMIDDDKIVGAGVAFRPYYFADKGRWYEPYARREGDSIVVLQIGSAQHNYFTREFYQTCIKGDTIKWSTPYVDNEGAKDTVSTYGLPLRDKQGTPIGVLGIDVSTEWIRDILRQIRQHPSSFSIVLSNEGNLISTPDDSLCSHELAEKIALMVNDSTVKKELKSNGRVTSFKFYDEEKGRAARVYYARKRVEPKWWLVKVCYDDEAFGELHKMRKTIMWMSLLGLFALGLIIQLFARNDRKMQTSLMKQQRIDGELKIAKDIQTQMLPRESSIVHNDVKLHGSQIPAREVGGDLYDFFIRDEKLFFCIGDVSGKGIPASFIMAVTQSLFHNIASRESGPAHIMNLLNATACRNNESNMFATLFIGVLDLPTGHLRYCNAGHEIPILFDQSPTTIDVKSNIPIGLFSDFKYEMQEMVMPSGSTLFLYTDGLTEARNGQREQFGMERVKQLVARYGTMSPKEMIDMTITEVERFSEHTEQGDDLTLLVINYTPMVEKMLLDEELTLANDVKEVTKLSSFIKDVMARLNIDKSLASKLRLALEEAVVNAMEYAYPAGSQGDVKVRVTYDEKRLRFIITDSGIPFNPTEASKADTTLSAEERPVGGLGIHLMRQLMDSVNYERINKKNVLTLTKNVNVE
ncbi:MAG: SpoIIE family protein phosphatase [Bacteroidaceae bacterium]|nr:SpoIIE family protein phosphatase [Bacteroidaceae bacterium]